MTEFTCTDIVYEYLYTNELIRWGSGQLITQFFCFHHLFVHRCMHISACVCVCIHVCVSLCILLHTQKPGNVAVCMYRRSGNFRNIKFMLKIFSWPWIPTKMF